MTMQPSIKSQVFEIRKLIDTATPEPFKYVLMDVYLKAGRICESVARKVPQDKTTTPYGPVGIDANLEDIDGHEAVVLTVHTAKRKGIERIVAVPTEFEPWAKPLYNYYKQYGNKPVFNLTRQWVWVRAKTLFEGHTYPIMSYKICKDNTLLEVPAHDKRFTLHALRHLRATELVRVFHFKAEDLAAYCGWRLTTVTKATSVMERYIDLGAYLEYFPKLLKKR